MGAYSKARAPASNAGSTRWITVCAFLLLISAAMVVFHARSSAGETGRAQRYVLVMDAGSSGTRIYAFTWALSQPGSLPVLKAVPPSAAAKRIPRKVGKGLYNRVETQPGLDHFVGDAQGLHDKALGPLLHWAQAVVPRHLQKDVPLFLLATGGLRRLHEQDQSKVMRDIRQVLSGSGFRFQPTWARIISGVQEGVYGWVALNYQEGHLQRAAAAPGSIRAADQTLAALDLGGSSLEVTFEVKSGAWSQQEGGSATTYSHQHQRHPLINASIAGSQHQLYTHTFKHYGLNEVYDRAITLLLAQQHQQDSIQQDTQHLSSSVHMQARPPPPAPPGDVSSTHSEHAVASPAANAGVSEGTAGVHATAVQGQQLGHKLQNISSGDTGSSASSNDSHTSTQRRLQHLLVRPKHATIMRQRHLRLSASAANIHHVDSPNEHSQDPLQQRPDRRGSVLSALARQLLEDAASSPGAAAVPASAASLQQGSVARLPVVYHPCLHKGYSAPYTRISYEGVAPSPGKVLLEGAADWEQCQALVKQVVNASAPCARTVQQQQRQQQELLPGSACRLGSMQPPLTGKFVALTGFYVVWTFFSMPADAPLQQLSRAARQLCERPWGELQRSELHNSINLERYCTWGPYMEALLTEGLGLDSRSVRIGSGSVAWTLGAALAEGSQLPDMMVATAAPMWSWRRHSSGGVLAAASSAKNGSWGLARASQPLLLLFGVAVAALALLALGICFRASGLQQRGGYDSGGGLSPAANSSTSPALPVVHYGQSQSRMRPSNSRSLLSKDNASMGRWAG